MFFDSLQIGSLSKIDSILLHIIFTVSQRINAPHPFWLFSILVAFIPVDVSVKSSWRNLPIKISCWNQTGISLFRSGKKQTKFPPHFRSIYTFFNYKNRHSIVHTRKFKREYLNACLVKFRKESFGQSFWYRQRKPKTLNRLA